MKDLLVLSGDTLHITHKFLAKLDSVIHLVIYSNCLLEIINQAHALPELCSGSLSLG